MSLPLPSLSPVAYGVTQKSRGLVLEEVLPASEAQSVTLQGSKPHPQKGAPGLPLWKTWPITVNI